MPTGLPTWRHTWSTFPIWKLRQDVHRQADHAQIIVQELFASGVVGRVSLDANRLVDLAQHLVNLPQRVSRDIGESEVVFRTNRFLHFREVETSRLASPSAAIDSIGSDAHEHAAIVEAAH